MKKLAAPIERVAYTPPEAAAACGVGPDYFDAYIAPHLRWFRGGNKRLVAVSELHRFMDEHAETPIAEQVR
jgi:hypothetical protein